MEIFSSAINSAYDRLFYEGFWLPKNLTWKDFELNPNDGIYVAQPRHLIYVFPCALVIFCIRQLFERFIAYPFGKYMNISTQTFKCTPNTQLEKAYRKSQYLKDAQLQTISKQTDLTERQIQRWFRRRRNQDRPSTMNKFTETAWRLFYYASIMIYGFVVLWNKSWFTNPRQCWLDNFPRQHVGPEIFWYYMIELGFYTCLIFSQFIDVKRKDFWEQFSHHLATIFLMVFSWMLNLVRVGTLVLCLHDIVDWMLEGAKLNRYLNNTFLCDLLFAMFTVGWFVTRLLMYPYFILYTTSIEANDILGYAPSIFLFNGLLWVLQILHVLWFIIIIKAAYKAVIVGQVEKDIRSCSEDSDSPHEEHAHKNGTSSAATTNNNGFHHTN